MLVIVAKLLICTSTSCSHQTGPVNAMSKSSDNSFCFHNTVSRFPVQSFGNIFFQVTVTVKDNMRGQRGVCVCVCVSSEKTSRWPLYRSSPSLLMSAHQLFQTAENPELLRVVCTIAIPMETTGHLSSSALSHQWSGAICSQALIFLSLLPHSRHQQIS